MAQPPTITVRRQVLDVEVRGTESDGLALQRRLPGVCADVLWPTLESALAPSDPGVAHLYVERLTLELADIPLDRLESTLAEAVHREVAEWRRGNPPRAAADVAASAAALDDARLRSVAETVDDALVAFLRTGRLPWSFHIPAGSRLEDLVFDAWGPGDASRAPPPATRRRLREVLAVPRARTRLLMQFSPELVATVLRGVAPELATAIEVDLGAIHEIEQAPTRVGATFVRRWWEVALRAAAAGSRPTAAEVARGAWHELTPAERVDTTFSALVERFWPDAIEHGRETSGHQIEKEPMSSGADDHADPEPRTPFDRDDIEPGWRAPSDWTGGLDEDADALVVTNAGIVLLHPFLPRFFDGLGIAADDELLDPGRAVSLLGHLATGEHDTPEHQLTVAKVLCGVPLDEPVEARVAFTDEELEEAVALLDAAIGHWEALRGTSPDALRDEFLMRAGSLAVDADGDWLLRVETRTVDILLDQLPWGLALVKLPWMRRLLRVEWR